MEIYTKVFFANIFVIVVLAGCDKALFNEWINDNFKFIVDSWVRMSFISIPIWLVYLLATL